MNLFETKKLYDNGMTADQLEALTGDLKLTPAPSPHKPSRSELRGAEKKMRSQVRRYHKIVSGADAAAVAKRRAKKKRANQAKKVNRA